MLPCDWASGNLHYLIFSSKDLFSSEGSLRDLWLLSLENRRLQVDFKTLSSVLNWLQES